MKKFDQDEEPSDIQTPGRELCPGASDEHDDDTEDGEVPTDVVIVVIEYNLHVCSWRVLQLVTHSQECYGGYYSSTYQNYLISFWH